MNKTIQIFLIFTLIATVFRINAQPVISDIIIPEFGDSIHLVNCVSADFQEDASGMNQSWDFSGLSADPSDPDYYFKFFSPGDTPFADRYPTASLAAINADSQYVYYILENGLLQLIGAVAEVPMLGYAYSDYSNPESEEFFPIEFNDTWSDTYDGDNVLGSFSNPFNGTVDRTVDAFGTLILPSGTFENVLRTKTERTFSTTGIENSSTLYTYTSEDYKLWLLSMEIFDDNTEIIFYQDNPQIIMTSVRDYSLGDQITVFPNPVIAGEVFNVKHEALNVENLNLFNASGQQMNISLNTGAERTEVVFNERISPGLYYLKGFIGNEFFVKKIIILHA